MALWALIDSDGTVLAGAPFDGETIEEAQKEVFDTLFSPSHPKYAGVTPAKALEIAGFTLVPMTSEHEGQYPVAE